jgi:type IV secretory pathway VirB10-like protein
MRKFSALCVLVALIGCGKKDEPAAGPPNQGSGVASTPPVPVEPPPAPADAAAAQVPELPLNLPEDKAHNVMHLGNKVEGSARDKEDVLAWIDRQVVPDAEPCIAGLPSNSTVLVNMKLGKDGRVVGSTVSIKAADGKPAKADKAVTDCIAKVGAAATVSTTAPGEVTGIARFVVQ